MVLNIALSYGGRQDIVNAVLQVHEAIQAGEIERSDVTEKDARQLPGHCGYPGPGSADSYRWRTAAQQLFAMAERLR